MAGVGRNRNETTVEPGRTFGFVYARLIGLGFEPKTAKNYATFCQAVYDYIQQNHDLQDSLAKIANANKLEPMARELQLTKSIRSLGDTRLAGGAGLANIFVDYFKAYAVANGIEINECSVAITKVCLDISSAGIGAVSSVTGVGVVWLGISVIATFQDSYDLGKICIPVR
jgi:hypothetical protein